MATISKYKGKRGVSWRAQIRQRGAATLAKTFKSQEAAQVWAGEQEQKLAVMKGADVAHGFGKTLAELIDLYLAESKRDSSIKMNRNKATNLEWWKAQMGHITLTELSDVQIAASLRDLRFGNKILGGRTLRQSDKPRKPATVNRYKSDLSSCLEYARDPDVGLKWLSSNPVSGIKGQKEQPKVRHLTDEERISLLESVDRSGWADLAVLVRLALGTGARRGELLNLTWRDVDMKRHTLTFRDTKNGEHRVAPLRGEALTVMQDRAKVRPMDSSKKVFGTWRNKEWESVVIDSGVNDWVTKSQERFTFHSLRHTAITYLLEAGVPTTTVADIVGHKTLTMVLRYAHVSVDAQAAALERMSERLK